MPVNMAEFTNDPMISFILISILLLLSKIKDLLDNGGLLAAFTIGMIISLLGHWTWLLILLAFLVLTLT